MLTLYIIPSDRKEKANVQRAIDSFLPMPGSDKLKVEVLGNRDLHLVEPETDWYGFLFDVEWLDEKIADALPVFMANDFDFLIAYKKVTVKGAPKIFFAPRFFRKEVKLIPHKLIAENEEDLKREKILNGWILEEDRL